MATFHAELIDKKKDGTRRVRLRITHNRKLVRIPTNLYVDAKKVTASGRIKDQEILDRIEDIIRKCRAICNDLGIAMSSMTPEELVGHITRKLTDGDAWRLDFIEYGFKKAKEMSRGTGGLYETSLRAVQRFIKRDSLDISEINRRFLTDFEKFILNEPSQRGLNHSKGKGTRAASLYLERIRALHNMAKADFNDEDFGIIRVPWSPFAHFKIKQQPLGEKRCITKEDVQRIIDFKPETVREEIGRDCFLLSFGLAGMNSADLYTCEKCEEGVIIYNRKKTATRRADRAEMHIRIPEAIKSIVAKYRDEQRVFRFYQMYSGAQNFNRAINKGLHEIADKLGIENLTYYSARHSWATIARSSALHIDKYTVHEALNHVDSDMRITDRYIERDWSLIWEANEKVVELFEWSNAVVIL